MLRYLMLALLACIISSVAVAQDKPSGGDTILVFDASGSMWGQIDGVAKITIARDVVQGLLKDLPPERRLGLVAYGHNRKGDCKDIQTLVPVGTDRAAISKAIAGINPVGMTPMTAAVEMAAEALKYTETDATVILISDGQETCHADPCAAAAKLKKLGVGLTVHTVGFGLTAEEAGAKGELKCMAEATGGRFFVADDADELRAALAQVSTAAPATPKEALPVEVALRATDDVKGATIEKGLTWTIRHGATGEVLHEATDAGAIKVKLPRGVHDVTVQRESDGASAEGKINSAEHTSLTLPIVAELEATLKAPETAAAGATVKVSWTGPGDEYDYISVAKPDADDGDYENHTRIDKGNPLNLLLPSKEGTYEIRYTSHKSGKVLARQSITTGAVEASLTIPETADAGATLKVSWTGPDYEYDYISVAKADDDSNTYVNYTRTDKGNPLKLELPAEPGTYEVRYVQYQGKKILAAETITTGAITASIDVPATAEAGATLKLAWTGPGYDYDFISVAKPGADPDEYVNYTRTDKGNPLKLELPAEPGTYEVRYVQYQGKTVLAHETITTTAVTASIDVPATAAAGSTLKLAWTGPDYNYDYISVGKPGADPGEYVNYTRTDKGNPLKLPLPPDAGTYEVRYVQYQGKKMLANETITTTPVTASLEVPASGAAESTVKVGWTGPDYNYDYISVAKPGEDGDKYANYTRTDKGNPVNLKLPKETGTYEIRYVQYQGKKVLATQTIRVTAAED